MARSRIRPKQQAAGSIAMSNPKLIDDILVVVAIAVFVAMALFSR